MNELHAILDAWAEAERRGRSAVLATVVSVTGSAYRRPGARMLMLPEGTHVGSISGGCLEGDVSKKAWWLTEDHRPALRVYDTTSDDDAIWEFGLGCNGVVKVLLERIDTESARESLRFFQACRVSRKPGAIATVIHGGGIGEHIYVYPDGTATGHVPGLRAALAERKPRIVVTENREYLIEAIVPPLPLVVCGAGHDALPLVAIAKELGWHVTVVDGRPPYATPARFPRADAVAVLRPDLPIASTGIGPESAVVLMSHNYPQDRRLLAEITRLQPRYLGVLGPRARTDRMLSEIGGTGANIHAPIGLDIGAETPEAIALSIVSEIQAVLAGRPGGQLTLRGGPIHEASDNPRLYPHPVPLRGTESAPRLLPAKELRPYSLDLA